MLQYLNHKEFFHPLAQLGLLIYLALNARQSNPLLDVEVQSDQLTASIVRALP